MAEKARKAMCADTLEVLADEGCFNVKEIVACEYRDEFACTGLRHETCYEYYACKGYDRADAGLGPVYLAKIVCIKTLSGVLRGC